MSVPVQLGVGAFAPATPAPLNLQPRHPVSTQPRSVVNTRGSCSALLFRFILMAACGLAPLPFAQAAENPWRMIAHEPEKPPYTSTFEQGPNGKTRTTRSTIDAKGRVANKVVQTYDKFGRPLLIDNLTFDEKGELRAGFRQEFSYGADEKSPESHRRDLRYDPKDKKWAEAAAVVAEEFPTKFGTVKVNLPNDMAAGDTISGVVVSDPTGKNDKEKNTNRDELAAFTVEVGPQKTTVGQERGKWTIPGDATSVAVVVRDRRGKEVSRREVPLPPTVPSRVPSPEIARPPSPRPSDFTLPTSGQAGRLIRITGPFDGDSSNTKVTIGGNEAPLIAESPRKLVVESPRTGSGPTDIVLTENNVRVAGSYRNLGIGLSAGKLALRSGEVTTLTVTVLGLQGIARPAYLTMTNHSSSVVSMGGGDRQDMIIPPAAVLADGTYVRTLPLTGIRDGSFTIAADVTMESTPFADPNVPIADINEGLWRLPSEAELAARRNEEWLKTWLRIRDTISDADYYHDLAKLATSAKKELEERLAQEQAMQSRLTAKQKAQQSETRKAALDNLQKQIDESQKVIDDSIAKQLEAQGNAADLLKKADGLANGLKGPEDIKYREEALIHVVLTPPARTDFASLFAPQRVLKYHPQRVSENESMILARIIGATRSAAIFDRKAADLTERAKKLASETGQFVDPQEEIQKIKDEADMFAKRAKKIRADVMEIPSLAPATPVVP